MRYPWPGINERSQFGYSHFSSSAWKRGWSQRGSKRGSRRMRFIDGAHREEGGDFIPAHSPRFYPADGSTFVGAGVLAETAGIAAAAYDAADAG